MNSFSIIICCYNSVGRIEMTLSHLAKLRYPFEFCELIVVDNNSSDNTIDVVLKSWNDLGHPFELRILEEKNQGVAHARKTGVEHSKFEYGIFCDDDNWLYPNYLTKAAEVFQKCSNVGLVGGASCAESDVKLPVFFYKYAGSYAVGIQSSFSGDVTFRKFLWGAGLCFRVDLLKKLYNSINPVVIGRKGDLLSSGEDGEICAWHIFAGLRLYYFKELRFDHYIERKRLTDSYYERFIGESYPSFWINYSRYLTVRYCLFPKGSSFFKEMNILFYFRDLFFCLLNLSQTIKLVKMERTIRKIANAHLSSNL
jgi:glycosyltransferase involved in cell wall biosynthesis